MVKILPQRRSTRRRGRRFSFLTLESLETRTLPSATTWPGLLNPANEIEPHDTLDKAQNLGDLSATPRAEVIGSISNGPAGAGVDWYRFRLDYAATVSISTPRGESNRPAVTTISLYNSDPNDPNDLSDLLGHRLLEQADSAAQGGAARIERLLAPGKYYVAISGSGNHYFNPFLAGSGYPGAAGDYGLLLTAANLGFGPGDGPAVLTTDPQPNANLVRSPFVIRVDLSEPLDPATVSPGGTVHLLGNANGTFGDGNDQDVPLASATLTTAGNELLIAPAAPLAPGYYQVVLAGGHNANAPVLTDRSGIALGTNRNQPSGADFTYAFQIKGNEGIAKDGGSADDTPATSHPLGDLTKAGLLQIQGAIGDDSTDPIPFNGSDVDLYHFTLSGSKHFALTAEVFAGRIGSPLYPGVSLFQVDPITGHLDLLGSNAGTLNNAQATDGSLPLLSDPVLYAGLRAGDYYLAVSNNFNMPDLVYSPPGTNGVFDPTISHSGLNGGPTGAYVLNLHVLAVAAPPRVLSTTPSDGAILNAPPTHFTVQFSEPVNLQELAYQASAQNTFGTLPAVYIEGGDGTKYYPKLESYDTNTNQATFLMLDGLGNGVYTLHFIGSQGVGLADRAGDPLVGNDPSGDYLVRFEVRGSTRDTTNTPLQGTDQEPNDQPAQAQDLGILFRHDLETGVTLQRDFTPGPGAAPADTDDYYRFQILEAGGYNFNFSNVNVPPEAQATLLDAAGNPVDVAPQPGSLGFFVVLQPGTYVLHVGGWTTSQAANIQYTADIQLGSNFDNPAPLTVGPSPAISIKPVTDAPTTSPGTPVVVNPPPSSSSTFTGTPPVTPPSTTGSTSDPTPVADRPSSSPSTPSATTTETPTTTLASAGTSVLPAAPAASVTLLVNLLVPSGVTNAGITPGALRGTSDRAVESVTLPSGALLALGAAPVGGIKDASTLSETAPADRILVRLPEQVVPSSPQPAMTVLSRSESGTSATEPAATSPLPGTQVLDPASPSSATPLPETSAAHTEPALGKWTTGFSQNVQAFVNSSCESTLEAFFSMTRWMEETSLEPANAVVLPEAISLEEEPDLYDSQGGALLRESGQASNVEDHVLVLGLTAALAAVAVARTEHHQRPEARNRNAAVRDQKREVVIS